MDFTQINQWLRTLLIIALVVALGMYSITKIIDYRYKVEFIKTPCALCSELNKNQSSCIKECFTIRKNLFIDGFGTWKDSEGNCYNSNAIKINCSDNSKPSLNLTGVYSLS